MEPRVSRARCRCAGSGLPLSSTLLFLSWILPTSSFAQIPNTPPTPNPTTTLQTSTTPPPSSISPPPPTSTNSDPPTETTSSFSEPDSQSSHAFNYYFLIVALVVVLFCICILYIGRRKRRKAALIQSHGQRALARDVEGWRTRFPMRRGRGSESTIQRDGGEEGLDERGEAPPPYAPGSKPPSIRTVDLRRPSTSLRTGEVEEVELGHIRQEDPNAPPGYHEHVELGSQEEDIVDVRRLAFAVTASDRYGSTRRLMSTTGDSSQA